jgi:serine-threonine kinase receptor-associated protein
MASLRQTPLTCSGHTRPVVHLDFSSVTKYGYFLISACKDGKPMLRQGDTGDWIGTFEGHKGAVWGVALNKDATKAASGAADFTGKVWDANSGEELHSFQHKHIVKSVNFSKDSTLLATGSNEKLVRIFDLNKPEASKFDPDPRSP